MDIAGNLPADRGNTTFTLAAEDADGLLSDVTVDTAGKLSYKVKQISADKADKYDGTFDSLVHEYADVFKNELPGLPPDRDIEHVIDTGDAQPINRHPFKMSPLELDELRRQLAELQTLGLIEPSNS